MYFEYGETEISYLKKKDKKLGEAIDKIGLLQRPIEDDVFSAIIRAIIGQQIARQARETVFRRMYEGLGGLTPERLHHASIAEIQAFGTTFQKAANMKAFAEQVYAGTLDLDALRERSDEEIIQRLCALKGIGVWTAEMLLAGALQRPDIFSFGDLAIHRGLRMLYRHKEVTKEMFARYRKRYSPYGTVASVYLWAIAAGAIPELDDPKRTTRTTKKAPPHNDYF